MKIGIVGNYGHSNNGDEAILTGILTQLETEFNVKKDDICVFSNNPEDTMKKHNVTSYPLMHKKGNTATTAINTILKHIAVFRKLDLLIIGGGGLLMDMYKRDAPLYSTLGILSKMLGSKVIIYGVGAGPINTQAGKTFIKSLINASQSISVRDINSKKLLEQIGVQKDIRVIGDPAFNIVSSKRKVQKDNIKNVGVTAVPYFSKDYWPEADEDKYHSYVNAMAKNLDAIIEKEELNVTLYSTKYPEDVTVTKDIFAKMVNKRNVALNDRNLSPLEIFDLSTEQDLIIGTRLHSLIIATSAQTPVIGIGYHHKVRDFMQGIEREEAFVEINNLEQDDNSLLKIVQSFQENWDETKEEYKEVSNKCKTQAKQGLEQLSAYIK
ncbi:polysaccharide pyruvyl transferase family protein [Pseudalkalibacillus caeni]|uniref:Polysaccharide pyruvyl transferase n=1 Tax=Exobacillus caeni TaxID=2574798 RepID=A0A5R9F164_9BACL|nr:polysaccharide pyruvyl transferase family protein [Pseudalkalibacillus caeni]TLS35178.1 polysaccharide pyruvyl transferase [Pseudalkalibacillus caeni]